MRQRFFARLILGIALYSSLAVAAPTEGFFPPSESGRSRADFVARSRKAMVATAHPLASAAAMSAFKAGGNAVDAAVAASFAISVLRPQSTGIGGGGFLLYHSAAKNRTEAWDFRERAPKAATQDMFLDARGEVKSFNYKGAEIPEAAVNGHLAVGVPGLVAGLVEIHAKHGVLPLATVMEPAIKLAADGFPVYQGLYHALELRRDVMLHFEGTAKIFFPGGKPLEMGQKLVQVDLATTLRAIAVKGRAGFYEGPVAALILEEMKRGKGLITAADLSDYTVKQRTPVTGTYRGYRIVAMPPPSSGGVHIVEMMNILQGYPAGTWRFHGTEHLHILSEVMRRAFADRARFLGDPDFVKVPVKGLNSLEYAATLRRSINPKAATPSAKLGPSNPGLFESPSTTHLSVVDEHGNAVSSTQTINFIFGSGVVAEGTGVVLNDEMDDFSTKPGVANVYGLVGSDANAIAAKKTMLSSMSPTLVFDKKNALTMVVGSPGGPRIINATLQTLLNVIDHKMPLDDAVHAWRIHHQWLPDEIAFEPGAIAPEQRKDLVDMGHFLHETAAVGDVQAIGRDGKDWIGVSDTRSEGKPMGL